MIPTTPHLLRNRTRRPMAAWSAGSRPPASRFGATLVEVLMALFIMAIGVTSVFTLFPISILKAIKAHQITDAKLFENSIKENLLTHSQLWTGAPEWTENTVYGNIPMNWSLNPVQDRWVAPPRGERLVPDSNQLFFYGLAASSTSGSLPPNFLIREDWRDNLAPLTAAAGLGGYQNFYNSPATTQMPIWMVGAAGDTYDGGITWRPYRHSPDLTNPASSAYVVDPLGWWQNDSTSPDRYIFGRIISGDTTGVTDTLSLDRIHCQLSSTAADAAFKLDDTWNLVIETTPLEAAVTVPAAGQLRIAFPPKIDVSGLDASNRVVLTSTQTTRTFALNIGTANSPLPGVLDMNGTLPAWFLAIADQARVEVHSPSRYSWLMSVHATSSGKFEAQCAVVHNRTFQALDEQGYRAEFANYVDLDSDTIPDSNEFNVAKIRWPYDPNLDPPTVKEGGYIFDASNAYWYQIKKVEDIGGPGIKQQRVDANDVPDPAGVNVRMIFSLNDAVKVNTAGFSFTDYQTPSAVDETKTPPALNVPPHVDCKAVLIPGVIHVFTISTENPNP